MLHQLLGDPGYVLQRHAIFGIEGPETCGVEIAEGTPGLADFDHLARRRGVESAAALSPAAATDAGQVLVHLGIHLISIAR